MNRVPFKMWQVVAGGLAVVLVVAGYLWWWRVDGLFHLYFLNIGQGDSVFMVMPTGEQVLVDGGPGNKVIEELSDVMPFFDKTIDVVVLTHPHADHMDGLIEVLKRYEVDTVMITGVAYPGDSYEEFLKEAGEVDLVVVDSESDFAFGEVAFDVLYPIEQIVGGEFENVNNSSIAMMVEYGGRRVLLTGDLELEVEEAVVAEYGSLLDADIFKAGHHGSRTAAHAEFLEAVSPGVVVIQVGVGNDYGHPHAEALREFYRSGVSEILRTDLDGRVEFEW